MATTPKDTTRKEQAQQTRERIAQAALELFAERGFAGTSTRRIAQAAGVSEGLIFHHFPNKMSILRHIYETRQSFSSRAQAMLSMADAVPTPMLLQGLTQGFLGMLGTDNPDARFVAMMIGEAQRIPELYAVFTETVDETTGALATYLDARVAAGELRADLDSGVAAQMLIGSLFFFFQTRRHLAPERWSVEAHAYTDALVHNWLRGALADPEDAS